MIIVTDCEGPLTINDNAQELCQAVIPNGDRFFAVLSAYDDYLADVVQKPDYRPGDTLRLILPFLKAFGMTDREMAAFSRRTLRMVPGVIELARYLEDRGGFWIVSTSYRPYLEAVAEELNLDPDRIRGTAVSLDGVSLPPAETADLKRRAAVIAGRETLDLSNVTGPADLIPQDRETVGLLDEFFWFHLPQTGAYRFLEEVRPVGGVEKAAAMEEIIQEKRASLAEVVYIGDSITDTVALSRAAQGGGGAVAFNGNRYALREANLALATEDARPMLIPLTLFEKEGLKSWNGLSVSSDDQVFPQLLRRLNLEGIVPATYTHLVRIERLSDADRTGIIEASATMRRVVRGRKRAALG